MKNNIYFLTAVLCTAFLTAGLHAGAEDDAKAYYTELYERSAKHLELGNERQKVLAATIMGTSRKPKFVRPLGRELLHGLNDPVYRKMAAFDPYVKSAIATALGQIGREEALPYLEEALKETDKILNEQKQEIEEKQAQAKQNKSYELVLLQSKPGPAFMGPKEARPFITSPDALWNVADEFKKYIAPDPNDEWMQTRLKGYNYVNLAIHILGAIGDLGKPESTEVVVPFLSHPYPAIRMAAALALGQIGTLQAQEALGGRYAQEEDKRVKVRIAFGLFLNDPTRANFYQDLLGYLKDDDVKVRLEAAGAMRELALGESYYHLIDTMKLEDRQIVRDVLKQAIRNAELDNLFPPNPLIETGPTRIWIHGRPYSPDR